MPCQHEIFCCRKLGLDPATSLNFKQRWFLKYPEKIKERLYAEEGVMTKHMKKDWALQKSVQMEKLKTSNHPDLIDPSKSKTIKKRSKRSKKTTSDNIVIHDSAPSMTTNADTFQSFKSTEPTAQTIV